MLSNKTYPETSETLENGFKIIQVKPSNANQAWETHIDVKQNEKNDPNQNSILQSQGLPYILLQILRWSMIIGFGVGCAIFVKDAWDGYQANEASIKISKKKVEYMEHPAVTMW